MQHPRIPDSTPPAATSPTAGPLSRLEAACAVGGLDLVQRFDIAVYQRSTQHIEGLPQVPNFDRPHCLALLVANTRALWPAFLAAYEANSHLRAAAHPLDTYVESVVESARLHLPCRSEVRYAHDAGERRVSMLHAAEASGLASMGPAYLAAHPIHGPWIALRALVVVDASADDEGTPRQASAPLPCSGCAAPCAPALQAAMRAGEEDTRAWVGVRDACPVGQASRYGEQQIAYHYTKRRQVLTGATSPRSP